MGDDHPLLLLQQLDASADALRARRAGLPERAGLQECRAGIAALAQQRSAAGERKLALRRDERRIEGEVADLDAKSRELERTLYSGKVRVLRELEALQHELQAFQQRKRELEDAELALMEQQEALDAELARGEVQEQELAAREGELGAAIASSEREVDGELARLAASRAELLPKLPGALLSAYEKLRERPKLAGRAAVRLSGGICRGCMQALPTAVESRMQGQAADAILVCPHCSRILLR